MKHIVETIYLLLCLVLGAAIGSYFTNLAKERQKIDQVGERNRMKDWSCPENPYMELTYRYPNGTIRSTERMEAEGKEGN